MQFNLSPSRYMAFSGSIFKKFTHSQQHNVQISCAEFRSDRNINAWRMLTKSFTFLSKLWLSVHRIFTKAKITAYLFLDIVKADLSKSDNNLENTGKSHLRPRAHHGFHCAGTNLLKLTGVTWDIVYRISL